MHTYAYALDEPAFCVDQRVWYVTEPGIEKIAYYARAFSLQRKNFRRIKPIKQEEDFFFCIRYLLKSYLLEHGIGGDGCRGGSRYAYE